MLGSVRGLRGGGELVLLGCLNCIGEGLEVSDVMGCDRCIGVFGEIGCGGGECRGGWLLLCTRCTIRFSLAKNGILNNV